MKEQFETKTRALMALAQAYETKNTELTSRIEKIVLPDEVTLPKDLNDFLNTFGNNPLEESELYKAMKTETIEDLKFKIFESKDKNIDDFDTLAASEFASELIKRITNKIDEDGRYKVTPKLENVTLPKSTQLRELKKLATESKDNDDVSNMIFKIAGVKKEDLSDWEQEVIMGMYLDFSRASDNALLTKQAVDRTPFAGYLKN